MEGIFSKGSSIFLFNIKSPGGGELSLSAFPVVGNRASSGEKIANPTRGSGGGEGADGNSKN